MFRPILLVSLLAIAVASPSLAEKLIDRAELGTKAAPLEIAKWVKGDPIDLKKPDGKHVYVVEFWATWCPPCRASIPHLTQLQKKYKDKNVVVIGVSDESTSVVESYVKKMGDTMDYTVAVDKDEKTSRGYMSAFGVRGIPHAFIVDQKGNVVWHDHPMSNLEAVIDRVLAGNFDSKKYQAERAEIEKRQQAAMISIDAYAQGLIDGKPLSEIRPKADEFMKLAEAEVELLNNVAWALLTSNQFPNRDLDLIETMAKKAVDASKGEDANALDTYAYSLFKNGKVAEAIKVQEKALSLEIDEETKETLTEHMAEFKAASKS